MYYPNNRIAMHRDFECRHRAGRLSPPDPLAVHVRPLAADVRLECPLEHSSPVEVSLVVRNQAFRVRRALVCDSLAAHPLSVCEPRTEIWPVPGTIERFPPVADRHQIGIAPMTHGRSQSSLPFVVVVIEERATEEAVKPNHTGTAAHLDWGVKEHVEATDQC